MKKLFVAAAVALLATPLFASEMSFDARAGYARLGGGNLDGGANGFVVGPAFYYSLYSDEGFVKDLSVGLGVDFTMAKASDVWASDVWAYDLLVGPEAKLEMPYSYFKLGFGYNYLKAEETKDSSLGMKFALGGMYEISEGIKAGLDFTFAYKLTAGDFGRVWAINVGPVFSFAL